MTSVLNSPTDFARQHLRGFALLHAELLRPVHGGVVRADRPPAPSVAVVTGGGTGHYPAFCGWVGPGMADGAAVGDVFASPSADQIVSVCRAADNGGGVLLAYGNYAGDDLNFTEARGRLERAGVRVQTLSITDDVTSAPATRRDQRRGTAGDLVVIKAAGAAAAAGHDLDRVASLAARANARTFSFGIAFAGCTLPGSDHPLFSLPPGHMGVGMGVHGEPGVGEQSIAPAAELAVLLVERLLEERPMDADGRVVALLNGLGSTGLEELFLLWGEVHDRLVAAGLTIVAPEVDELVTSLDMEGVSLTVCWLDDELQALWTAPCRSAAFTRNGHVPLGSRRSLPDEEAVDRPPTFVRGAGDSARQAAVAAALARRVANDLQDAQEVLGVLDSVAGDGDHGLGMVRGAEAAALATKAAADQGAGLADTLTTAGIAWSAASGGTSGALWGAALRAAGARLTDDRAATSAELVAAVRAARDEIVRTGGAVPGDKTMIDALSPFVDALESRSPGADGDLRAAWDAAARTATRAAEATADLVARRGRARPLAARSLGHPDPGAVSLALVLRTLGRPVAGTPDR